MLCIHVLLLLLLLLLPLTQLLQTTGFFFLLQLLLPLHLVRRTLCWHGSATTTNMAGIVEHEDKAEAAATAAPGQTHALLARIRDDDKHRRHSRA